MEPILLLEVLVVEVLVVSIILLEVQSSSCSWRTSLKETCLSDTATVIIMADDYTRRYDMH